ncbi:hypothetical protein F4775DRAFT_561807 [Biscogniauxia sp. FL1348]|nr:hypothetical protein F4775DRAFT_561807 [Biscogniauxia sp. FL1348]
MKDTERVRERVRQRRVHGREEAYRPTQLTMRSHMHHSPLFFLVLFWFIFIHSHARAPLASAHTRSANGRCLADGQRSTPASPRSQIQSYPALSAIRVVSQVLRYAAMVLWSASGSRPDLGDNAWSREGYCISVYLFWVDGLLPACLSVCVCR